MSVRREDAERELAMYVDYLVGLPPSAAMVEPYRTYLDRLHFRASDHSAFDEYLERQICGRFTLGLADIWSRLYAPKSHLRYKLNAAFALCECDAVAYEKLQRTQTGTAQAWLRLLSIGVEFALMLLCSFGWVGITFLRFKASSLNTQVRGSHIT